MRLSPQLYFFGLFVVNDFLWNMIAAYLPVRRMVWKSSQITNPVISGFKSHALNYLPALITMFEQEDDISTIIYPSLASSVVFLVRRIAPIPPRQPSGRVNPIPDCTVLFSYGLLQMGDCHVRLPIVQSSWRITYTMDGRGCITLVCNIVIWWVHPADRSIRSYHTSDEPLSSSSSWQCYTQIMLMSSLCRRSMELILFRRA